MQSTQTVISSCGWDIDNDDFDKIMAKFHSGTDLTHEEQTRLGYYIGSLTKGAYSKSKQMGKVHCTNHDEEFADDVYTHLLSMMKYYDPHKGTHAYSFFYGAARFAVIRAGQDRKKRFDAENGYHSLYDAQLTTDLKGEIS